ncbi:hypothetical protein [Leptospirillum ferriphilum]|uniref:Uncharacterized protein n=2 Tax=Leptospirillum ferriphilum TaxID=178606 RepID=A0A059Y1Q9_9BACT|nr:hypothetical protein [Leptospirillum ferriphilum]AIA31511.1 hypothetical protein Y981_02825 [Leptospirillum ferriphilum YSK]OOH72954.1 hypothetical protein BOX24_06125 [Leptospirillum ferriphilum]
MRAVGNRFLPADRIVPIDTIPHIFICVREKMGNQGECMPDSVPETSFRRFSRYAARSVPRIRREEEASRP